MAIPFLLPADLTRHSYHDVNCFIKKQIIIIRVLMLNHYSLLILIPKVIVSMLTSSVFESRGFSSVASSVPSSEVSSGSSGWIRCAVFAFPRLDCFWNTAQNIDHLSGVSSVTHKNIDYERESWGFIRSTISHLEYFCSSIIKNFYRMNQSKWSCWFKMSSEWNSLDSRL